MSRDPACNAAIPVVVRRMHFALGENVPRYWHSNSPFLTHYFTALSILFPGGERFFIDSVHNFEAKIDDPELRVQVRAFVQQEAHHTTQHMIYNQMATQRGIPAERCERLIERVLRVVRKVLSRKAQLAMTVCLEHFTAVFANQLLANPKVTAGMHRDVKPLWLWHAVEETEHKAVAWEVYQRVCGSYWLRALIMARVMLGFPFAASAFQFVFLLADRKLFDFRDLARGMRFLWGRGGFIRSVTPELMAFYRRDFHPWQFDNRHLIGSRRHEYQPYVTTPRNPSVGAAATAPAP